MVDSEAHSGAAAIDHVLGGWLRGWFSNRLEVVMVVVQLGSIRTVTVLTEDVGCTSAI